MTNQLHPELQTNNLPSVLSHYPKTEETIQWLAETIAKGLCRVYAVKLNESKETEEIVWAGIDDILQQAKALGREGNFLHVQCTRVANEMVVLSDSDPRYDWILPAAQNRLREELHNLPLDPAVIESQALDLTNGEPLRFLGFELCCVRKRGGELRVQYRLLEPANRPPADAVPFRQTWLGSCRPLRFMQPCLTWIGRQRSWQLLRNVYRKVNAIQVSWTHLPITMYPIVVFLYGWRSPAAWVCLALIFLCNWRQPLALLRWGAVAMWRHKLNTAMGVCILAAAFCAAAASVQSFTTPGLSKAGKLSVKKRG